MIMTLVGGDGTWPCIKGFFSPVCACQLAIFPGAICFCQPKGQSHEQECDAGTGKGCPRTFPRFRSSWLAKLGGGGVSSFHCQEPLWLGPHGVRPLPAPLPITFLVAPLAAGI